MGVFFPSDATGPALKKGQPSRVSHRTQVADPIRNQIICDTGVRLSHENSQNPLELLCKMLDGYLLRRLKAALVYLPHKYRTPLTKFPCPRVAAHRLWGV